ncbi:MAG: Thiol-disulfide oxidoreductase ResA [Pseudomonadota bacterium]
MNLKLFHMALIALLIQASPVWAVEAGKPLPDLGLAEVQKTKGQYIYIDYWASWCGPCRQSFPWMNALQAKLGPKGLKVVAVNVDAKRADADKFLSHTPAQFTIAYDPQGGRVLFVHSGFRAEETLQLEARISAAMGN